MVLARLISRVGGEAAFFVGIWGKAAYDLEATPGQLATVMAALGVASLVGASVAFGPFLTDDEDRLAKINSWIGGASWTAFVLGPAAGAVLAGSIGIDAIFALDASTSVIAAILLWPVMNAVGVLAYVGTDIMTVVAVAAPLWGLIIGQMAPLHRTMVQINSPEHAVGRIMGVNHLHSEVGHLLPLAFAPVIAVVLGVQQTLLASGAIVAIVAAAFFAPARRLDRTRTVDVPPPGLPDPVDEPKSFGH